MSQEYDERKHKPIINVAIKMLQGAIRDLISGKCSEHEIEETIAKLKPPDEYINPNDYATVDKLCDIVNCSRVTFYKKYVAKDNESCFSKQGIKYKIRKTKYGYNINEFNEIIDNHKNMKKTKPYIIK